MVVRVAQLRVGVFLFTGLETPGDHVLLTHGNSISAVQLQRIRVFQKAHAFREPVEIKRGVRQTG